MTKDESDFAGMPSGRIARLKYAVGNLWSDYGNVDSVGLGIVINVGLALLGVLVYTQFTGVIAIIGAVWAVFNLVPVAQWVFDL
jgi:Zn-dependent protease